MGFVVDLDQILDTRLRVPLRGGKRSVSQQFLNRPQVGAVGKQMRGESMTQRITGVFRAQLLFEGN